MKLKRVAVEDALEIKPPLKVNRLEAEFAMSLRKNDEEATPPSFLASKADGTVPMILRGSISPSQTAPAEPPISTPKYRAWLKLTEARLETLPSWTEKRPLVTVTLLPPVRDSVQTAEVVA